MVLDQARNDIVAILKKARVKAAPADIVFPPNPEMGDLSLPLFAVAKERKVAPGALAQDLQHTLKPKGLIEKIEITGPYVNFLLKRGRVAGTVLQYTEALPPAIRRQGLPLSNQRIMLEMVSPNNNKPLHLGHLRNAFLGESVSRLLEAQGAKIIRACLFSDRGLHIAKAMLAYKLWGKGTTPTTEGMRGDQFVVQWYVLFEQESKKQETKNKKQGNLIKQAEELVQKWEAGDKDTVALWKKMAEWAMEGIDASLARLGMKFNVRYFESKLWKQGKNMVAQGLKKGVFKKDESGAVVAEFQGLSFGATKDSPLPPKVLLRSDGTAIYATSDLALTPEKFSARGGSAFGGKKYKLNRAIWCVGQEQDLYLKQLFTIMKMLGYKWADRCEHLTYGLVHLPEGRMKTREGTVVEADPLLDHMGGLVKEEVKARHTHLTEKEIEDRAEIIAQAAVRYYLLKVGPKTTVQFDPQASIAFTGDTGPYLLYTYARIASILRKSEDRRQKTEDRYPSSVIRPLSSENEWQLILLIARFPEIVSQAANDRDPSHLAKYLYTLAQQFSNFYEQVPVLKSEEPARSLRLALIKSVQATLKQGLRLLTIKTVEEM